ncbi:MAG: MFS transporter [Halobacteriota archaeon]|nr:MFS transporter [Halobacteriota archaeon]
MANDKNSYNGNGKGNKEGFFKGITLNVILLGFVSLFTDLSSQMVFPLLPLYLTKVLGASALIVGLVEGAAESIASLLKVFSGYWSDKIEKRKPFILGGYGLSAIIKPLFAVTSGWGAVLALRVIERVGKGIRNAPRDAIVAESCDECNRGKAYGVQRSMDGLGSVLGVLMALFLFRIVGFGYREIFLIAAIPAFVAIIFILFVREKRTEDIKSESRSGLKGFRVSFSMLPRNLKLLIVTVSIFTFGNVGYAFLLLRAIDLGFEEEMAFMLYAFYYVIYTLLIIPSGVVSDRIGRRPVLFMGYALFGLLCVGLMTVSTLPQIVLLFGVYGIFFALTDGVQRAYVVDLAPPELKATSIGAFHTAIGLTSLPAGLIAGGLWEGVSPETTFLFGSVMSFIAAFLLLFLKEGNKRDGVK